jgi:hypothetical protein
MTDSEEKFYDLHGYYPFQAVPATIVYGTESDTVYALGADAALAAEVQKKRVEAELELKRSILSGFGDDLVDGTIVQFWKQFTVGGREYMYAAIRADGKWYTTGPKSPKGYTWEEFTLWLVSGIPASAYLVVKQGGAK